MRRARRGFYVDTRRCGPTGRPAHATIENVVQGGKAEWVLIIDGSWFTTEYNKAKCVERWEQYVRTGS